MKSAWKTFLVASSVVAASLGSATPSSAGVIISVGSDSVSTGGNVSLELRLAGAENLVGYQVSVAFDPDMLEFIDVTEGDFFETLNADPGGFIDHLTPADPLVAPGHIGFIAAYLSNVITGVDNGNGGNGLLATIQFKTLKAGTTTVTPFFDSTNPDDAIYVDPLLFTKIVEIEDFAEGVVTAEGETVPEPVSMLSLALGLGAVLERRRRRQNRAVPTL